MSTSKRVLYTLLLVGFIAALQLGTSVSRDQYACPTCPARSEMLTTTILFVPLFQKELNAAGSVPGHQHQWVWQGGRKHSGVSLLINGTP